MYINKSDQIRWEQLLTEYLEESQFGTRQTPRTERLMTILFTEYFDKIINGIIFNQQYRFWRFSEMDDLCQEARAAIMASIHKQQFDPARGNIFNFFSTVVSKNLMNYTKKQNRYLFNNIGIDINDVFNNENVQYYQNYNDFIILEDTFKAMRHFFSGKDKFVQLTNLLEHYYILNTGKKFVKKKFISFAKAHNFSPASVNNFFSYCKKMKLKKEVRYLLEVED